MTLLETERLVRKISELLQSGGNPDLAPKLAGDYAAACHSANVRLQQCEAMLKAGDRHQAIQLAETAPNLLDLVTILEFREADKWRALCQQDALPVADRIDARSVHALNECYAQGITTDHPLYAAYRAAVLHRNDEAALQALQSITRLNPADANAASELARLDAKVLEARLDHLDSLLAGGDTALIVAAIEAIEAFGFKGQPAGEPWRKANLVRCMFLLQEAADLKPRSRWKEALAKLDFVSRLRTELQLELPAPASKEFEALNAWAQAEREKDLKNHEFSLLLAELHARIHQSEEKDTSARYVQLPELRDDFEGLCKTWRSLTDFARPLPEDAASAFKKRSSLLEAEIARRTAIRRRVIVAGCAAAMVVGGLLVWFVLGQMKARDFAAQLRNAVSQRQVRSAERLLDRLRTGEKHLLNTASVNSAAASADTFLTREHSLLTNFEGAYAKLPSRLEGEPDLSRIDSIAENLAQVHAALSALAPDLKAEKEPGVQAFETQWQRFLSAGDAAVNGFFEQWVTNAEQRCAQLDYRKPVETAMAQISELSPIIHKLNDCQAGATNHLNLRNDLQQRAASARAKFTAYEHELGKLDQGMAALQKAKSFSEWSSAVTLIASSEFSGSPVASAAAAVQALAISDETTLRRLLGATKPGTWAFISKSKPAVLMPELAMPAETDLLRRLSADPAVNANHQHYRLWLDRENSKSTEWITVGMLDNSEGWKQIKAWTLSPTAANASFEDREYGFFGNQWKLSPTEPIFRLEHLGRAEEASAFPKAGLTRVWPGGDTYGGALLDALDAVKNSREGSPLFRAYLFCKIVHLMEFQPDAWGLSFCPSAPAHASQIQSVVGGQIESGDWFVPSKVNAWSEKLEQLFSAWKPLSYAEQAAANLALAQSVAKDGLRYVGFVGLDGKPTVKGNPAPAEVWGYNGTRKAPTLLSGAAMPLSPVFALATPRAEYLAKAHVDPNAPSFGDTLLPLFRVNAKP